MERSGRRAKTMEPRRSWPSRSEAGKYMSTKPDTELKIFRSYPNGEYNADMEIEATRDGIELDLGITIDWEWIDSARQALRRAIADSK
jgi:hypothetical protein